MPRVWQEQAGGWGQALPDPTVLHKSCRHPAPGQDPQAAGALTQTQGIGGPDALLLPALPWLKMHCVNQRTEPRTPKPEAWGDSTGDGWELQEKLWLVGTGGMGSEGCEVGPQLCWVVVGRGGLQGGLHFWGSPCSPAGRLGTVRGGAEGSKRWGRREARELWVIICY